MRMVNDWDDAVDILTKFRDKFEHQITELQRRVKDLCEMVDERDDQIDNLKDHIADLEEEIRNHGV